MNRLNFKGYVKHIKSVYPKGTEIILDHMEDPFPIPDGTKGVVLEVDDIGTLHCMFEGGRQLGIVPGEDFFHKVNGDKDEC